MQHLLTMEAEIQSALLISFDLFQNVFCIPWRINDNFEL